jgi:hypothetical protein
MREGDSTRARRQLARLERKARRLVIAVLRRFSPVPRRRRGVVGWHHRRSIPRRALGDIPDALASVVSIPLHGPAPRRGR